MTRALAVRLKGPSGGFHIETAAPETQWFDTRSTARDENEVRWRWIVTPHKSGERPLQLAIAMRTITADGMVLETTLPEHPVSVRVSGRRGANLRAFGGWAVAALVGASVALLGTGSWMVVIAAIGRWFG